MAATTTVRLPGAAWGKGAPGALTLIIPWGKGKRRLVLPWLPEEIERSGLTRAWEQQPRPGRKPLNLNTGRNLRVHTFTVRICAADLDQPVSALLDALEDAAEKGKLVTANLGPRWLGEVNITGLTIREGGLGGWDATAAPVDATVDIELTEARPTPNAVGPVAGHPRRGRPSRGRGGAGGNRKDR